MLTVPFVAGAVVDNLDTIWTADPHTLAKHAILERYLQAWFPILSRQSAAVGSTKNEILFIDGFAGPGIYKKGEPGSPVIAMRAARKGARLPLAVRFLFIERDRDRFEVLRREVDKEMAVPSQNRRIVEMEQGECGPILTDALAKHEAENLNFGPALAFLDQFGYGDVSIELVSKIMQFGQCEVFSYIDYKNMNRWIGEKTQAKHSAFDRAFGGSEWKQCIELPPKERRSRLLELYIAALKTKVKVKYVKEFLMFDANGAPLYWLVFCTNSLRGLEEMKRAMWTVDETGEFRFSDHDDPDQLDLLGDVYSQVWLAKTLRDHFAGRTVAVLDVKEHVLVETPCYQFKQALKQLEEDGAIKRITAGKRRKGGFVDEAMQVTFSARPTRLFE
jgi:three-Cys-motif partner protein